MSATCTHCNQAVATAGDICVTCKRSLGLAAGDGVRPRRPCARCNHAQLIRAQVRELTTSPGDVGQREVVPMAVTYEVVHETSWWSGAPKGVSGVAPTKAFGVLELYVCRRCGFAEWYCRDPEAIRIGPAYGTELIDTGSDDPYR